MSWNITYACQACGWDGHFPNELRMTGTIYEWCPVCRKPTIKDIAAAIDMGEPVVNLSSSSGKIDCQRNK